MDYLKILNIVRRYLWLFVLAPLVASLTTLFVVGNQPTSYRAATRLLVGPSLESPSPNINSLRIAGQLIQTYAELAQTRPFLASVNNKLEQKIDIASLGQMITTRQNIETRILNIIVFHPNPNQAVAIANAAAETFLEMSPSKDNTSALLRTQMSNQTHQLEEMITKSETTIQQLETQLAELESARGQRSGSLERQNLIITQLAAERGHWADALRTLTNLYQLLLDPNTNQLEIIEPATAASPVNDGLPLRTAASGVAGLILAVIIAFAFEYFDDTIRSPQDFFRATKVRLLSRIEKHNRLNGSGLERVVAFAQPTSRAANNYRTAVAKLLFSIGESRPCTFLLSSVGSQSGDDTAVATANLGVAFAQAGNRVVLVDAQFHNPVLTELFDANGKAGLADLLANKSSKLKLVPLKEVHGVQFLPAGLSSDKRPGAMLNSASIVKLIEELQKEADIVLVLGSPISWFAESLVLASNVNGVILVARYGEAHIKMVNEVTENLRVMNVQLAGAIFDNNPSPFVSRRNLKNIFAGARTASKAAMLKDLKSIGQVDADTTRPPDLAVAAMSADENTESTSLDQVDIDTIQTPDMGNLPVPTDEIEVSNLVTVDVDPVPSSNLTDSITSVDDLTSLEEVTVDLTQTQDLEAAAMPAAENTVLPDPVQVDVDITRLEEVTIAAAQTEDLEPATMPTDENTVLPNLGQVDVDTIPSPDLADAATLSEEKLELALLDTDVEKAKINDSKNSKGSRRANHRKRNGQSPDLADAATSVNENLELPDLDQIDVDSTQSPDLHDSATLSEEKLELALLDTDVEKAKINDLKNSKGSHRVTHRKRNKH